VDVRSTSRFVRSPSVGYVGALRSLIPALLVVFALPACDRRPSPSVSTTAPSDQAATPVDAAPALVDAMAAPVDAMPAPVDAAFVLQRAHELYPTAKHVAVEGDVFAVISFVDTPLFDQATRFVRRVFQSYVASRFAKRPTQPVYILLFTTSVAFDDYSSTHYGIPGRKNLGGFQHRTREIIADVSAGERALPTLAHEMAHSFIAEDFPRAPLWFNECVATVFESPRWVKDEIHGAKWSLRFTLLSRTLSSPATAPQARFDRFFGMEDNEFRGIDPAIGVVPTSRDPALEKAAEARGLLHFASARYACLWLDDLDPPLLTPFYEAWRDTFASDRTGEAAFERIVGATPAAVQGGWMEWAAKPGESTPVKK
jgi:hypothetical protein